MGKRALVFGASGVTGWSFVNEILNDYPKQGVWDGVVAMTNRSLKQEDSFWPADSRLQIVSGVDLLGSQEEIETALKEKVEGIEKITHVYYLGKQPELPYSGAVLSSSKHIKQIPTFNKNWRTQLTCSSGPRLLWTTSVQCLNSSSYRQEPRCMVAICSKITQQTTSMSRFRKISLDSSNLTTTCSSTTRSLTGLRSSQKTRNGAGATQDRTCKFLAYNPLMRHLHYG